jgi:hypothetical protein
MKMVKGIVRPEKVEAVVDALAEDGFETPWSSRQNHTGRYLA